MASKDFYPSPPPSPTKVDPILRNALRYTVSAKEYETLHQYLISRTPPSVRKRTPQPQAFLSTIDSRDDFNAAAVRASLRVFVTVQTGLKVWDFITERVIGREKLQKS